MLCIWAVKLLSIVVWIQIVPHLLKYILASEVSTGNNCELINSNVGEFIFLHEFTELKLCCAFPDYSNNVTWLKDGVIVDDSQVDRLKISYLDDNNQSILTIFKANSSDIGDYECLGNVTHMTTEQLKIKYIVRAKPRVKFNFTQLIISQSVYVRQDWQIKCVFLSPNYQMDAEMNLVRCSSDDKSERKSCTIDNLETLVAETQRWVEKNSHRVTLNVTTITNQTLAILTIKRATFKDKGHFTCVGQNFLSYANISIMLRVHDQFDALWPMIILTSLGLFLFSLVGIYETRRIRATSLIKLEWDKNM